MEKLTRSFGTEADSGKDASSLTLHRLNCLAPGIASRNADNWGVGQNRPAPVSGGEVFATDVTRTKSNHWNDVARIAIKAKCRVLFVDPADVIVAKAQGNYVALVHKSGSYLVRETMATAEQKLAPMGFVRIHRSILVNAKLVKDLRRDNKGTYLLRTTDGSEHPVGRSYRENLRAIAKSWLGVDLLWGTYTL
jgi:DNA-binding LytR/AlgR family response regulator